MYPDLWDWGWACQPRRTPRSLVKPWGKCKIPRSGLPSWHLYLDFHCHFMNVFTDPKTSHCFKPKRYSGRPTIITQRELTVSPWPLRSMPNNCGVCVKWYLRWPVVQQDNKPLQSIIHTIYIQLNTLFFFTQPRIVHSTPDLPASQVPEWNHMRLGAPPFAVPHSLYIPPPLSLAHSLAQSHNSPVSQSLLPTCWRLHSKDYLQIHVF